MKYVVVLGDGMADYPVDELDGKTPLQVAEKPVMDELASCGLLGLVQTVPKGMHPGSDTANLSVMGYDPRVFYSGRSPFEAVSMGVPVADSDVTFRCNLVTLSEDEPYEEKVMLDHSADEISSQEARLLIDEVGRRLGSDRIRFYPGISYRHLMVWTDGPDKWRLTPPHDILGKKIGYYLPDGPQGHHLLSLMKQSALFLAEHEVNRKRLKLGLRPANSVWIWGEGRKPRLSRFSEKYGVNGAVISAVDLIKGIGLCAGLQPIEVEGATGTINTNFRGKAEAALRALEEGMDFVYIHLEAPDECGHRREVANKVKAIELIDRHVIGPIKDALDKKGENYRLLILPDHATPLALRTHTDDPVPFILYQNGGGRECQRRTYDEFSARSTGVFFQEGHRLMDRFISTVDSWEEN